MAYRPVERGRAGLDRAQASFNLQRTLIGFVLVALVAYVAWKFVPPYRTSLKVREVMGELAFSATTGGDADKLNLVLLGDLARLGVVPDAPPVWHWGAEEVRVTLSYALFVEHPVLLSPTRLTFSPAIVRPRNLGGR